MLLDPWIRKSSRIRYLCVNVYALDNAYNFCTNYEQKGDQTHQTDKVDPKKGEGVALEKTEKIHRCCSTVTIPDVVLEVDTETMFASEIDDVAPGREKMTWTQEVFASGLQEDRCDVEKETSSPAFCLIPQPHVRKAEENRYLAQKPANQYSPFVRWITEPKACTDHIRT
jgi:hypothetical protein